MWPELLCCLASIWRSEAALNVEQVLEEAVLRLRERVYISDGLVYKPAAAACDSLLDGPHCSQRPSGVTDGIFSSRLLSSSSGGEMLDEYFLGAGLKAVQQGEVAAARRPPMRGRSALLSFRGLPPWPQAFPRGFAGRVPFSVRWHGPWELVENQHTENDAVKKGRWVAQLRGAVGRIVFGRAVSLQSVDLCRGPCDLKGQVPTPVVLKGRYEGGEVFNEVVPDWDLRSYVNGVAFFALTSTDVIDELVFIMAECISLGAIQLSFSSNLMHRPQNLDADPQEKEVPLYLTMREGWHAAGWEEIEFRIPSLVHDLPVWSLNEVIAQKLALRPGVFEHPSAAAPEVSPGMEDDAAVAEEEEFRELLAKGEEGAKLPSSGPEPIGMPEALEEILDTGTPLQDISDLALAYQRNASMLWEILGEQLRPELMLGVQPRDVDSELLSLLEAQLDALEGRRTLGVAQTPGEVTDFLWRQLSLDTLDTIFLRYHSLKDHEALSSVRLASSEFTMKVLSLLRITEERLQPDGAILSATSPSFLNGEQVEVLVEARELEDGSPSDDVRVTIRNAQGVELTTQHTQVHLLGNAEEIRRALQNSSDMRLHRLERRFSKCLDLAARGCKAHSH